MVRQGRFAGWDGRLLGWEMRHAIGQSFLDNLLGKRVPNSAEFGHQWWLRGPSTEPTSGAIISGITDPTEQSRCCTETEDRRAPAGLRWQSFLAILERSPSTEAGQLVAGLRLPQADREIGLENLWQLSAGRAHPISGWLPVELSQGDLPADGSLLDEM